MPRDYETPEGSKGHTWVPSKYDDGADIFAYTAGQYHNGPRCSECGYGFCQHCDAGPSEECPRGEKK